MRLSTLKRMLASEGFDELCRLVRLDALASSRDLGPVVYCERRKAELAVEELKPAPLLDGNDLIAMGHTPGPRLGAILRELADAQLEGEVKTRDEASAWVRRRHAASESG
jgi:poly(A) polymerase